MSNTHISSEVKVADIMQGKRYVVLLHDEKRYALTITRRGKLILTAAEDAINEKLSINTALPN